MLGISERWVQKLENKGVLRKVGHGRYPLSSSVQAYVDDVRKAEQAKHDATTSSKVELLREKARKARRENDEAENKLIPIEGAMVVLDMVVGTMRTGLSGLPARITDDIELREVIEREVDEVLHHASETLVKASQALAEGGDPLTAM